MQPSPLTGWGFFLSPHIRGPTSRAQNRASIRAHNARPFRPANMDGRTRGIPPIQSVFVPACVTKDGNQDRDARGLGDAWTPNGEPSCGRNWTPIRMRVKARNVCGFPLGCRKLGGHLTARWRWTGAGIVAAPNRESWTARWAGGETRMVEPSGGLTWEARWTEVGAERGAKWAQIVGLDGRPTLDGHLTAQWAATKPMRGRPLMGAQNWAGAGRPTRGGRGRSWAGVNWAPIRGGRKRAETAKSDINFV